MQATPNIGHIIEGQAFRDAVHVAVAPVTAACPIKPGHHVYLNEQGQAVWGNKEDGETIGIADPFLTKEIKRGERFWLFLYPGSITSLRHVWSHPAFEAKPPAPAQSADSSLPTFERVTTDG